MRIKEWTITTLRDARYVLMHTFAHLLIKQMSMASGYSSSAIRERIYFGDDMSGVLLYTGSSDKEGSLGGLVELGNISQLRILMRDAFQEALVCTNDPECLNNMPAGNNSNGAACHSCCMISETACENGNRMLDRGLIVPLMVGGSSLFQSFGGRIMSTGCMNLDILLDQILSDALAGANESVRAIQRRYPSLSEREASEIFSMISSAAERNDDSAD